MGPITSRSVLFQAQELPILVSWIPTTFDHQNHLHAFSRVSNVVRPFVRHFMSNVSPPVQLVLEMAKVTLIKRSLSQPTTMTAMTMRPFSLPANKSNFKEKH